MRATRWLARASPAIIALAAIGAYSGSLSGPFVADDVPAIATNGTLSHFFSAWFPPPDTTVSGRPVLNVSFAANYALGGLEVRGFHLLNLAIHILAGLTLFGIVRRTGENGARPGAGVGDPGHSPALLALAVALLWTLHPLQTESVTYIVQRAESLMGLFYLLTLYCFIRYSEASGPPSPGYGAAARSTPILWAILSVTACFLGMATKEVMVTAPLVVLLYDRTFLSGSLREAWRRRSGYYVLLAGSWVLLAVLLAGTHGRGGTAGFGTPVPWAEYALFQFWAIARYLRLALWPHPLIFDYGRTLGTPVWELAGSVLLVLALLAASGLALCRRGRVCRVLGFTGAWFFLILAPSSSIVPVATELMAEHRMYLPLAAMAAVSVLGADAVLRKSIRLPAGRILLPCLGVAAALGGLTFRRNRDYRSEFTLWRDTVAKLPGNALAHNNLGQILSARGLVTAAAAEFRLALRQNPEFAEAHNNLGTIFFIQGNISAAVGEYGRALALKPDLADAHHNLGLALAGRQEWDEAIAHYQRALQLRPAYPEARNNLGIALAATGKLDAAITQFQEALRLRPNFSQAANNLNLAREKKASLRP